jgi:UDP-N-acetylmuramoylalanine--D-glutamate ligase
MRAHSFAGYVGHNVVVLGYGKSGYAAARALRDIGARVLVWDDGTASRERAATDGFAISAVHQVDWTRAAALVISPGIPHTHPAPHAFAVAARQFNVPIIGDIELLLGQALGGRWVGVTGTNGKSTTTALIGHVLARCGRNVRVGGNIGTAALSLPPIGRDGITVLEMSSYQLEITPSVACDVSVLLNITPDHLDRHGGMEGYIAAKKLIFRNQRAGQTAVIGVDDEITAGICAAMQSIAGPAIVPISSSRRLEHGVFAIDGALVEASDGHARTIADLRQCPTLPGRHNWQNAAAAYAACRALGCAPDAIAEALADYPGLPHRQQRVGEIDGVLFVNDSKATNADAASKALGCYDTIWWIAGGLAKEGGIDSLDAFFPRIRRAYLIGKAASAFAATLSRHHVDFVLCETLERATNEAARDAAAARDATRVVLLSPACASFDQFTGFEQRGERFGALVRALASRGKAA